MEKPLKTQGSFVENIYNQQRHRIKRNIYVDRSNGRCSDCCIVLGIVAFLVYGHDQEIEQSVQTLRIESADVNAEDIPKYFGQPM